ncbi:hypothetical protein AN642_01960 [Epulopiscium sp. SCG-B10WGA-EpuloA2]|nr:hypothetical protein AN642_01960 [Epulopiscium sp. SCG-B10WGA-EpuloA2]
MDTLILEKVDTTLTVVISDNMTMDNTAYKVINTQKPKFLLPCSATEVNGKINLTYQVDNRMTLEDLSKKFSILELCKIYASIIKIFIKCEDWFLNITNFCQDANYIYIDIPTKKVLFIYAPIKEYEQNIEVTKKLLVQLLNNCKDEDSLEVMKFYRYFAGGNFTIEEFKNLLDTILSSLQPDERPTETNINLQSPTQKQVVVPPMPKEPEPKSKGLFGWLSKKNKKSDEIYLSSNRINENLVYDNYQQPITIDNTIPSEAMLTLVAPNSNFPRLDYQIPIVLIGDTFSIGRQDKANKPKESDYEFDVSVKSISRKHANIIKDDDIYYLIDLKSSNGTFLNDEKLKSNIRYELNYNDKISFSKQGIEYWFTTEEANGDITVLI